MLAGEPIEYTSRVDGPFGAHSIKKTKAFFIVQEGMIALIKTIDGRYQRIPFDCISPIGHKEERVICSLGHEGRWVDHGPSVGKGYYCPICKDDIPHTANTYGVSFKAKPQTVDSPTDETYYDLKCTKSQCLVCLGSLANLSTTPKINDVVECFESRIFNSKTGKPLLTTPLKLGYQYKVYDVTPNGLKIVINQKVYEFTNCRFKLVVS